MWYLLILLIGTKEVPPQQIEFNSEVACEVAKQKVDKNVPNNLIAVCVSRG